MRDILRNGARTTLPHLRFASANIYQNIHSPKGSCKKNGENARTSRPNHAREADVFRPANDGSPPAERIKTGKKQMLQPLGIVKPAPNFADVQTELYERLSRKIRPASPAPIPETL